MTEQNKAMLYAFFFVVIGLFYSIFAPVIPGMGWVGNGKFLGFCLTILGTCLYFLFWLKPSVLERPKDENSQ